MMTLHTLLLGDQEFWDLAKNTNPTIDIVITTQERFHARDLVHFVDVLGNEFMFNFDQPRCDENLCRVSDYQFLDDYSNEDLTLLSGDLNTEHRMRLILTKIRMCYSIFKTGS